jgi:hypothetical protein
MKKIIPLFIAITLFTAVRSFGQIRSTLDLIGIWTSSQVRVEFIDNSNVALIFPGTKKQYGTYTSDFVSDPSTLQMSFTDGNKKLEFKCLIQFVDNNTLKWESFNKNDYPFGFTNAFSFLTKVKN